MLKSAMSRIRLVESIPVSTQLSAECIDIDDEMQHEGCKIHQHGHLGYQPIINDNKTSI